MPYDKQCHTVLEINRARMAFRHLLFVLLALVWSTEGLAQSPPEGLYQGQELNSALLPVTQYT